jgi:hypothetical protein
LIQISRKRLVAERIVALALLTRREAELLGPSFDRLWPVDETPCFSGLLEAIDEADRNLRQNGDVPKRINPIGAVSQS